MGNLGHILNASMPCQIRIVNYDHGGASVQVLGFQWTGRNEMLDLYRFGYACAVQYLLRSACSLVWAE